MRYHFEEGPHIKGGTKFGKTYICDHPVYSRCTLYSWKGVSLAVIQQRFNSKSKFTYWTELDPWLVNPIFMHDGFVELLNKRGGIKDKHGLYPTVTVRQIMWALRMKPLKKEPWETTFDRKSI